MRSCTPICLQYTTNVCVHARVGISQSVMKLWVFWNGGSVNPFAGAMQNNKASCCRIIHPMKYRRSQGNSGDFQDTIPLLLLYCSIASGGLTLQVNWRNRKSTYLWHNSKIIISKSMILQQIEELKLNISHDSALKIVLRFLGTFWQGVHASGPSTHTRPQ